MADREAALQAAEAFVGGKLPAGKPTVTECPLALGLSEQRGGVWTVGARYAYGNGERFRLPLPNAVSQFIAYWDSGSYPAELYQ